MQLGSDVQIPDGLLAAMTPLSEKPRLGFGRTETTVHRASIRLNCLNGNRVSSTVAFEGRPVSLMAQQQMTTGKERDSESGLDYFGARYYGSALGRFTSPDWASNPVPVPFANIENPQTLNLYAYVQNNPLSLRDKDGHDDYTYDQSGKQTDLKKRGFWHNLFFGNSYTMNLTAGGSISLYGPVNALANGQQYNIVSAPDTINAASSFVNKNVTTAQGMTLDQFKQASKNGAPFDFKRQLDGNSLYMWSDGKAYDSDGIGNITWGCLSTVAVNGSISNGVAHLGAAYALVFIDKTSQPSWIFSHTLGHRPQDFDAINAGRSWGGEDLSKDFTQGLQAAMTSGSTIH